jgi:hypothetical protein
MQQTGLITGASSGIGKEFARLHAEKGRDLIVVARREDELKELKQELEGNHGISVMVIAKDLTKPNACQEIFDEVTAAGVRVDYLFNNAGFGGRGKFWEQKLDTQTTMIDLNVQALVKLTYLFLPAMVGRNSGRVLHTSSTAAFMPGPLQAVYFATKAFVNSFSKAVAHELKDTGVTMTTLCPGAVKTGFAEEAGFSNDHEMFAQGKTARYTAEKGYAAMEAGKLEVITETGLKVMIKAAIPFTPERLAMSMIEKMQAG